MTQYFIPVFLEPASESPDAIRAWVDPMCLNTSYLLADHAHLGSAFMNAIEYALCQNGDYRNTRLVWAGDHADEEVGEEADNLYFRAMYDVDKAIAFYRRPADIYDDPEDRDEKNAYTSYTRMGDYRYIVNHTQRLYIDKEAIEPGADGRRLHPLPLLTAEGLTDYSGSNLEAIGTWARDVISVEWEKPSIYNDVDPLDYDDVKGNEYARVDYDFRI